MFSKSKIATGIALIIVGIIAFVLIEHNHKPVSNLPAVVLPAGIPPASDFMKLDYQQQADDIKKFAYADPIAAWSYLKSVFLVNGQVIGNAHGFAHLVGNGMYAKYGLDGITNCDSTFAFGCFHGVTEQLLADQGTDVVLQIQDRCTQIFPPTKSQDYTGCIHGMGHGLLTWEHFNLSKALVDCDILDSAYQTYCYDGVFMEHASDLATGEFDPTKPWQFCTALDQKYQYNCARYQSQIFLSQFGSNIPEIGADCAKTSEQILSTTCFESLGFYITQTTTGNLAKILDLCGQINSDGKYHCIIGATREVAFQAYAGWQDTGQQLCASLPADLRDQCGLKNQFTPIN